MHEFAPGLWLRDAAAVRPLRDYRLIAFDMDSTLISIETVDELAEAAGRGAEVAAITEAAMRGELPDYKDSLRRRVALLRGLPQSALDAVYEQRLRLNPGVPELIAACKAAGLRCILVTGGFTCFTDRLRERLGLDGVRANVLELQDGRITGQLLPQPWGDIVDGAEKRRMLLQTCAAMGIDAAQSIAMGDGANDLPMMDAAGLAVAYRAKPVVRAQADVAIDTGGLDRLLDVLR
ncbi:MAG: phosphoserine phosphatase SerB [Burkholderiaceae bacterium]|nr:MAG: phosphoserine phosphatase SerB [Burkholderiaceae bacterium]